jgi:alpha-D-ribose 1-methylphosphonate 5-triphosphate synthase subunit PhnH
MFDATYLQSPAQAAHAFRAILSSFSKPAVSLKIATADDAPLPLLPAAATVLLTLADYQTPIWLSPELNVDIVRKYLRFHTGAPITTAAQDATFALLTVEEATTFMPDFNLGDHEYPDRSTTVIMQVSDFAGGLTVAATGPGLEFPVNVNVAGPSDELWRHIQNNNSLFPIGNDFVFTSINEIMSLPRSSQIAMMENA